MPWAKPSAANSAPRLSRAEAGSQPATKDHHQGSKTPRQKEAKLKPPRQEDHEERRASTSRIAFSPFITVPHRFHGFFGSMGRLVLGAQPADLGALSVFITFYRWFQVLEFTGLAGSWCPLYHRLAGLLQRDPPADKAFGRGWTRMKSNSALSPSLYVAFG